MSSYFDFPSAEELLMRLRRIDLGWPPREGLYQSIAGYLAGAYVGQRRPFVDSDRTLAPEPRCGRRGHRHVPAQVHPCAHRRRGVGGVRPGRLGRAGGAGQLGAHFSSASRYGEFSRSEIDHSDAGEIRLQFSCFFIPRTGEGVPPSPRRIFLRSTTDPFGTDGCCRHSGRRLPSFASAVAGGNGQPSDRTGSRRFGMERFATPRA